MRTHSGGKERLRSRALVLLSGGLDSTACVHFYLSQGFAVESVFLNYGQIAAAKERLSAATVAAHYGAKHRELEIAGASSKRPGVIQGRNALLLLCALAEWESVKGLVVVGIHGGTHYHDSSPCFVKAMQVVFDLYSQGQVRVAAPFLRWSKRDIWEYCRKDGVPTEMTYSCQQGGDRPCGQCESCLDRKELDAL